MTLETDAVLNSQTPELRMDATATMPVTRVLVQREPTEPRAPPLAAFKQSRVLSFEVLLAAPTTTTTASATGLTATSTVFKNSRALFIEDSL